MAKVEKMSGRTTTTQTELQHKHQCAVRQLLYYRHTWGLKEFRRWVDTDRVRPFWYGLEEDFVLQWRKGNRGTVKGQWL